MFKQLLKGWFESRFKSMSRLERLFWFDNQYELGEKEVLLKGYFKNLTPSEKISFLNFAATETHEPLRLDKLNQKMIRPVEGLVIDGNQYYEFVSSADMPEARFVHFNHLRQELAQGMDIATGNKYLEEMKVANNTNDRSRNGALIYMMQDTMNNCTPLESLYNIAALIYFEKFEDLSCFDNDYNAAKIKAFKAYPNQGFFLSRLILKGLKNVGKESPEDIQKYLRASAVKLKAYQQMLSERSEIKTSEPLTKM